MKKAPQVSTWLADPQLSAIARSEGWHTPPRPIERVRLRAWQQAVFWGLRIYIVAMLVMMAIGFAHIVIVL